MRVTVCELPNYSTAEAFEESWRRLTNHVALRESEAVVLPEMPFDRWLSAEAVVKSDLWEAAVAQHEEWLGRLAELGTQFVFTSKPVADRERRHQESVAWERKSGFIGPPHRKRYLPEEPGFWEARWYEPGPDEFALLEAGGIRFGFMICTEIWFSQHARAYGKAGAHLIISPRASTTDDPSRWLAGGRTAAVVAGAFCLSSNFTGPAADGRWAGESWIIDPDGAVLATTSEKTPFATVDIDLGRAEAAKSTYPRYVKHG